jgi:hypothetical protein
MVLFGILLCCMMPLRMHNLPQFIRFGIGSTIGSNNGGDWDMDISRDAGQTTVIFLPILVLK